MPNYNLNIIVNAKDQASGALGKIRGSLGGLGKMAIGVGAGVGVAGVAVGGAFVKMALDAAPLEGIQKSFEGVTKSFEGGSGAMLAAMKKGSKGMITNRDLMTSFNKAAQLVSKDFAQKLPDAMGYLGKASAATGQDMDYMMDSLVTGIGRLSPMILDNLGIQVNLTEANEAYADSIGKSAGELTKAEQQTALMNQVMEKLAVNTAEMPDITDNASTKMAQLGTMFSDVKDKIGVALLPLLTDLMDAVLSFANEHLPPLLAKLEPLAKWMGDVLPKAFEFLEKTIWPIISVLSPLGWAIKAAKGDFNDFFELVRPAFEKLVGWIEENLPKVEETVNRVFAEIKAFVVPLVRELKIFILELFGKVVTWTQDNWPLIEEAISDTMGTIKTVIEEVLNGIKDFWEEHGEAIKSFLSDLWDAIQWVIETALGLVLGIVEIGLLAISGHWDEVWDKIKEALANVWNTMTTWLRDSALPWMATQLKNGMDKLVEIIKGVGTAMYNAGKSILESLWDGLKSKMAEIIDWLRGKLSEIVDMLPFSEPKDPTSPLRGLGKSGEAFASNWLAGLQRGFAGANVTIAGQMEDAVSATTNLAIYGGVTLYETQDAGGLLEALQELAV